MGERKYVEDGPANSGWPAFGIGAFWVSGATERLQKESKRIPPGTMITDLPKVA